MWLSLFTVVVGIAVGLGFGALMVNALGERVGL